MHFQLRFITTEFDSRNAQISVSDTTRKMDFLPRKRIPEDVASSVVTGLRWIRQYCVRERMTETIHREAVISGQLAIKKGAVRNLHDEIYK
jgi:hypothetical protein